MVLRYAWDQRDTLQKEREKQAVQVKKLKDEISQKNARINRADQDIGGPSDSSEQDVTSDSQSDDEEDLWERTVKAKLYDVTKDKLFYCHYLDSLEICEKKYYEDSIMLDGLREFVYVTFDSRDVALQVCEMEHDEDSNFTAVEMATAEDFDTYKNLMSVHGHRFDTDEFREDLTEFVELQSDEEVVKIMLADEIKSAVVVFNPHSCHDVTDAIWKCADKKFKNNVRLRTAPVFRSLSVKVTGMNPYTKDKTLERYLRTKHMGGGHVKSFQRRTATEAVVTFEELESYNRVLEKTDHSIKGSSLTVTPFYSCLSKEMYKECILTKDPLHSGTDMQDPDSEHSSDDDSTDDM